MGEVYLANDTRLDRDVAIKVLPSHLAEDQTFRARFEREAKTLSHLNHPHVCALYDVGYDAGTTFLVMEHLEGETLASRIARRSTPESPGLPVNEAIRIAIEIASALDAAHSRRITHRDLKPGNVMLTKTGAKLLDFGLAKAHAIMSLAGNTATAGPTVNAPTDTPVTAEGTILGTYQYMAPEQLEGGVADARTDIFAFGALLHEMITGRKAFQGSTPASVIGSILKDDPPPLSSIQKHAPSSLDFVVRKCLAKDPDERWQSARDVMSQLEWIAQQTGSPPTGSQSAAVPAAGRFAPRPRREFLAWTVVALLGTVMATQIVQSVYRGAPNRESDVRFEIATPDGTPFGLSISPDGRFIAFVAKARSSNSNVVWLRALAATQPQPLPGTVGAWTLFWSPDSRSIGFGAATKLKRVDIAGGVARTICDVPTGVAGAAWNPDNTILFSTGVVLFRVGADGGQPTAISALDQSRGETAHQYPAFLPDGRHFVYAIRSIVPENGGVFVASLDAKDRTRLLDTVSQAAYAAPGYLIYQRSGSLMAQPFDAARLRLTGPVIRIADAVTVHPYAGLAAFDVSASGPIVYRTGEAGVPRQLQWFDRTGKPLERIGQPWLIWSLALSPDERRVAFSRPDPESGRNDIWMIELATGVPTRVTFDPAHDDDPAWTPDGLALSFWSDRNGKYGIYRKTIGSSVDALLYESSTPTYLGDWSRDGNFLLYHNVHGILALPMIGPREPRRLIDSPHTKDEPHFSPDGKWVAYQSDESGAPEVYVASFPEFDKRRPVSLGGGGVPWWRADGGELFYMSTDGKVMSVAIKPGPAPEFGAPAALFQSPVERPSLVSAQYVVTRNGQRFLIAGAPPGMIAPITVVLDWTRLLPH
jgi:serine/threonine protein kinase/Tol biopolymer transport system component